MGSSSKEQFSLSFGLLHKAAAEAAALALGLASAATGRFFCLENFQIPDGKFIAAGRYFHDSEGNFYLNSNTFYGEINSQDFQ